MSKKKSNGESIKEMDEAVVRTMEEAAETTVVNDEMLKKFDKASTKALKKLDKEEKKEKETTVVDTSGEEASDDAVTINNQILMADIKAMKKAKGKKEGKKEKEKKAQKRVTIEAQQKPKEEAPKKEGALTNGEAIQKWITQSASVKELEAALAMAKEREAVQKEVAEATGTAKPETSKDIVVIHRDVKDTGTPQKIVSETFTREFVNLHGGFNEIRSELQAKHDRIMREYTNEEMRDLYASTLDAHIQWIEKVCMKTRDVNFLKEEMKYEESLKKHLDNDIDPEKMLNYFKNARIEEILVPHDLHINDVQALAKTLMQKNAEFLEYLTTRWNIHDRKTMAEKLDKFERVAKEKYEYESDIKETFDSCSNAMAYAMSLIA